MSAIAIIASSGCAALGSAQATYGCQAADAATTLYAVRHGAVEANPLMAGVLHLGALPFVLAKLGIAYVLTEYTRPEFRAPVNALTCGVAVHNVMVVR